MLKGHTKIELTDVNTGEIKTVEKDNMITNIVDKIFNLYFGPCIIAPFEILYYGSNQDDIWRMINNIYGGLYLFDSQIEENADTVYPPGGARLTGFGADYTYSGANLMSGSYNFNESGVINEGKGYKHVWDFSTNQGNGTVASVCLTSKKGGRVSCGSYPFSSDLYFNNTGDSLANFKICSNSGFTLMKDAVLGKTDPTLCLHIDLNKDEYIHGQYSELYNNGDVTQSFTQKSFIYKKGITLSKVRLNTKKVTLFDTPFSQTYNENKVISKAFVEMPVGLKSIIDNFLSSSDRYRYISSGKIIDDENYLYIPIFLNGSSSSKDYVVPNEKFYFWVINVNDFSSTYFEVTNTIGENIRFDYSANIGTSGANMVYAGDYILAIGLVSKKMYLINKSNNTDVTQLKYPDGSDATFNDVINGLLYDYESKKIYFNGSNSSEQSTFVVDLVAKEVTKLNVPIRHLSYVSDYVPNIIRKVVGSILLVNINTHVGWPLYLGFMPTFLSTINNLDTPVTKTQSQTMKVTYTITKND